MTLSKKSYKTHQLLIKKHPGIPQPSFEPTQDFKQGSKMSSSNGILLIHSHVSKFHGNNLEFPRNEEGMLPSPSEPPEVSQPSASNNEKAAAQKEAAITLKGTFRYLKKWFWVRWVQCIMIWLYKNTLMHTTLRTLQGSGTGVKITVHSLGGDKHRDWKVLLKIQLKKKKEISYERNIPSATIGAPIWWAADVNLTRKDALIYIKIKTGRFLLPGWKKLQNIWHI